MSQFWYDKKTSDKLSRELLHLASEHFRSTPSSETFNIACISCPTLFKSIHGYISEPSSNAQLDDIIVDKSQLKRIRVQLFEFDKRFDIFNDAFSFYDYRCPLELDEKFAGHFHVVISDPPYLSEECHIKTGMTIRKISQPDAKLIVCTGNNNNNIIFFI